jgi:hypothetical protein
MNLIAELVRSIDERSFFDRKLARRVRDLIITTVVISLSINNAPFTILLPKNCHAANHYGNVGYIHESHNPN